MNTSKKRPRYSRAARTLGICGWYLEPPKAGGRHICKLDAGHKGKHE